MNTNPILKIGFDRTCKTCGVTKPIEEFVHHKTSKHGYAWLCLTCNVNKTRKARKKNIEKGIKRNYGYRPKTSESWRKAIIDFLIKRDGFICGICKESLENSKIHIDHIIPYALGGKCTLENMQLAHQKCNTKVGAKIRNAKISGYEY